MSWRIGGLYLSSGIIDQKPFLLDAFPNASFALSFRRLRAAYSGSAVRLQRASDSAQQDFGFTEAGDFDTASATSFIGGSSATIVTWYDQSGNGVNFTASGTQPGFTTSGINGKPSYTGAHFAFLDAGSRSFSTFAPGTSATFLAVANWNGTQFESATVLLAWFPTEGRVYFQYADSSNQMSFDWGTPYINVTGKPASINKDVVVCGSYDGSRSAVEFNGTALSVNVNSSSITAGTDTLALGAFGGSGSAFQGNISEVVYWGTDLGDIKRPRATQNMKNYYGL